MKTKVGIVFGGRSREHEISILSAASVMAAIDREKYEPLPFAIDKTGVWHFVETDLSGLSALTDSRITTLFDGARRVTVSDFDAMTDFAFPLLHGPFGEDGTIQGLFEMLGKPYAGCGVAASAISMDKIFTKEVWIRAGLPVCGHTYTTRHACAGNAAAEAARIEREIPYPIFVKPANMGSSVGVSKVADRAALEAALGKALEHDKRVIAEETVCGRELEVGLLGNGPPSVSAVGEILPLAEYYDYDSKYRGGGTKLAIPADIPDSVRAEIEALAVRAYLALDGAGFARIDLFYNENARKVYFSEMNAIPGFTQYSMFPLLWRARGVEYAKLIERIIGLGNERHHSSHHR
ncbi:MAG: D-alanine--D-alanine ligase [Clostridiales Family XIII bacterium]|nr:D-alanine--D-alanine ligase [Clostridiales Family XIII bacterium]